MYFWLTACMLSGGKPQSEITADDSTSDPATSYDSAAEPADSETDICDSIFLLELSNDYSSEYIWRYDIQTHSYDLSGQLDCPKVVSDDFLVALSADSKGLLWAISHESDVFVIRNDTLDCSYTQINAQSEHPPFIGRSLAFLRQNPEADDELYFSGVNQYPPTNDTPAVIAKRNDLGVSDVTTIPTLVGTDAFIDLAGTADGRLFGLRPNGAETAIIELDPVGGSVIQEWPTSAPAPRGWSFVWHDNRFWLFVSLDASSTSVYHFDPSNYTLTLENTIPFQVVGAALPACVNENSGS